MATGFSSLEVRNGDVSFRVSCQNYGKHLRAAIQNLMAKEEQLESPLYTVYAT